MTRVGGSRDESQRQCGLYCQLIITNACRGSQLLGVIEGLWTDEPCDWNQAGGTCLTDGRRLGAQVGTVVKM